MNAAQALLLVLHFLFAGCCAAWAAVELRKGHVALSGIWLFALAAWTWATTFALLTISRRKPMITVLFTCHRCGLQLVRVEVPIRQAGQDIRHWMEQTAALCGRRHDALSRKLLPRGCPDRKVDLAIPLPAKEGDGLGMSMEAGWPDNMLQKLKNDLKSKGAN